MITRIYIHAGTFHADDVMSVSIVRLLNPAAQYERIIRVTELDDVYAEDNVIVADIGGGIFDHHGPAAKRAGMADRTLLVRFFGNASEEMPLKRACRSLTMMTLPRSQQNSKTKFSLELRMKIMVFSALAIRSTASSLK